MFVNVARATSFMAETARRLQDEVEDCDLTVKLLKYRIAALQDGCVPPVLGAWVTLGIRGYGSQNWGN